MHGTATLRTQTPVARSQLLPALQSLLAQNGAALVQAGSLYRVVPAAQAAAVAAADGTAGIEPVPLRYASAEDLARLLQPFIGDGGRIAADAGRNVLLVSGSPDTRDSLVSLIRTFDIDVLAGQSYALLPVQNGGIKDFASALQDAFRGQSGGPLAGRVRVVPMERINAVLAIAAQPAEIEQVRRVFTLVERARARTVRSWHVYYLQNSHSEDVAYVLQRAFTPNNVTAQPSAPRRSQTGVGSMQGAGGILGANAGGGAAGGGQSGVGGGVGAAGGGLLGAGGGGAQAGTSPLAHRPPPMRNRSFPLRVHRWPGPSRAAAPRQRVTPSASFPTGKTMHC